MPPQKDDKPMPHRPFKGVTEARAQYTKKESGVASLQKKRAPTPPPKKKRDWATTNSADFMDWGVENVGGDQSPFQRKDKPMVAQPFEGMSEFQAQYTKKQAPGVPPPKKRAPKYKAPPERKQVWSTTNETDYIDWAVEDKADPPRKDDKPMPNRTFEGITEARAQVQRHKTRLFLIIAPQDNLLAATHWLFFSITQFQHAPHLSAFKFTKKKTRMIVQEKKRPAKPPPHSKKHEWTTSNKNDFMDWGVEDNGGDQSTPPQKDNEPMPQRPFQGITEFQAQVFSFMHAQLCYVLPPVGG
jgi:hypothetical protein